MKPIITILLVILFIAPCYSQHRSAHYAVPYRVKITMLNGRSLKGTWVEFSKATMTIAVFDGGRYDTTIRAWDIKKLAFRRAGAVLRTGLRFMGVAAAGGAIIGYDLKDDLTHDISKPGVTNAFIWGGISAGAGFVAGAVTGAILSHRFTINGHIESFSKMQEKMLGKIYR